MSEDTIQTARAEHRDFAAPDEVRTFDHGQLELLRVQGSDIGRLVLHPGWRWSQDVKPLAGTEFCEAPHFQYHVAGTLHIQMADGTEFDKPRPGHRSTGPARRLGGRRRGRGGRRLVGREQLRQVSPAPSSEFRTAEWAPRPGNRFVDRLPGRADGCLLDDRIAGADPAGNRKASPGAGRRDHPAVRCR